MTTDGQRSLAQRLTGIDEIECVTPDLNGVPRGKVMTAEGFLEGRRLQLARGVLLQCIMGGYPPSRFYGSDDGDLALVADPKQIHRLPWSQQPRALAICDADELTGESSRLSTRGQLKAVVARYAALGLAPVVATELEFFVFAPNPDPTQPFQPPMGMDGRREDGHSAFSVSSNNGLRPFFSEVYACMAALGLPRDTFMHEMGVSQFEINLLHGDPLLLADQTFLFKHLLKEVALKHGLTVVCMAKPLAHTPGSSMHIHQSVVEADSGRNVFSDEAGEATATFRHFIGGQQACLADFTALFAPNVNSYQRLCHPFARRTMPVGPMITVRPGCGFLPVRRWPGGSRTACRGPMPTPTWRLPPAWPPGCMGLSIGWSRARRSRANSKCRIICRCHVPCMPPWSV